MTDVSIVVPIYNMEERLNYCIESVLNQTWNSLELILVNDGSTDASGELCQFYADQDERVLYINQQNKGVGGARNSGLDIASGDYIYFLDSDDRIEKDFVERCMSVVRKEKYDVLTFDTTIQGLVKDSDRYSRVLPSNELLQCSEVLRLYIENEEYCPTIWLYMYKRSYLSSNNLRFTEGMFHEDNVFTYRVLTRQATFFYIPCKLHFHQVHGDSIMGRSLTSYHIECLITVLKEMIDVHSELGSPKGHYRLLRLFAWLPLRVSLDWAIFNRHLMVGYLKILIENPKLMSVSILKSILKFVFRLGRPINKGL